MTPNNLLIISIDALNSKDLSYIQYLPTFHSFIKEGSLISKVTSVYPTLTYCCHTSIITGNYPNKHGIYHNEKTNPYDALRQFWFWYKKDIRCTSLFDLATKAKLRTASVLWPVMASAKNAITYNVPEIWSDHGVSSFKLFLRHGSLKLLPIVLSHRNLVDGKKQPQLDNFSEAVTCSLLEKKHPNILTLHLTELDTVRHYHGVFSSEAYKALDRIDQRLEHIIATLKRIGTYENTNIVLLGDHGGNDFDKVILLNSLFKQKRLLDVDQNGVITQWKVYANSSGGSAQIVLSDPTNIELYTHVESILRSLLTIAPHCIKNIFTQDVVGQTYHNKGDFSFMIEAIDGYVFRNNVTDSLIASPAEIHMTYQCDHGYLPTHENMYTMLLAKGPNIRMGYKKDSANLIDEGPTFAKLLGLSFDNCDGKVIDDILR